MLFYSTHLLSCCGEILKKEDKWHILTYAGIHDVCIYTGGKKERNFKVPRVKKPKKTKKNPIKPKMSKIPSEQG